MVSDRDEDKSRPVNTFVRGKLNEPGENPRIIDLGFHEYCAGIFADEWYVDEATSQELKIVPQLWLRTIGRRLPVFMILITGLVVITGELSPTMEGVSSLLGWISTTELLSLMGLSALWIVLLYLLEYGYIVDRRSLAKPVLVYGLLGILTAGTAFTIFLVYQSDDPTTLSDNIVFASGWLLANTIGGILCYDSMIRGENMLWNLGKTSLIQNTEGYEDHFRTELKSKLEQTIPGLPVTVSVVFAILSVSQFGVFWLLYDGPQGLNSIILTALNVLLNIFMMTGVYQFVLILSEFRPLLQGGYQSEAGEVSLHYDPFHPDGRGGFRDLGQASMRINGILIVGGLYYVYRLLVQGQRTMPDGLLSASPSLTAIFWTFSYVIPFVLYFVLVACWLYFTFWQIHLEMVDQREQLIIEAQQQGYRRDDTESVDYPGDLGGEKLWEQLKNAPVWPIDSRQLTTLLTVNLAPLLLTMTSLPI